MFRKSYKDRVIQLRDLGMGIDSIPQTIYKEYKIRFSKSQVQKILAKVDGLDVEVIEKEEDEKFSLVKIITEILTKATYPLMAKEIRDIIKDDYGIRLDRKLISQTLYSKDFKDKVYHNRTNWTYTLLQQEEKKEKSSVFDLSIEKLNSININEQINEAIQNNKDSIETGNLDFDSIVKLIIRDNKITKSEEAFLKQKVDELELDPTILERIKNSLFENNPFLDDLINLILEDGLITDEELKFLSEKTEEYHFSNVFASKRFWELLLTKYSNLFSNSFAYNDLLKRLQFAFAVDSQLFKELISYVCEFDIIKFKSFEKCIEELNVLLLAKLNQGLAFKVTSSEIIQYVKKAEVFWAKSKDDKGLRKKDSNQDLDWVKSIINEERLRVGSPDANLLAENIIYRLKQ